MGALCSFLSDSKCRKDRTKKKKKITKIISFDDEEGQLLGTPLRGTAAGEDSEDCGERFSASGTSSVAEQMDTLHGHEAGTSLKHPSEYLNGDCGYLKLDVKSIDDEEAEDHEDNAPRTLRNHSVMEDTEVLTK